MSALPRAKAAGPSASAIETVRLPGGESMHGYAGDTVVLAVGFGVLLAIAVRIYPKLVE